MIGSEHVLSFLLCQVNPMLEAVEQVYPQPANVELPSVGECAMTGVEGRIRPIGRTEYIFVRPKTLISWNEHVEIHGTLGNVNNTKRKHSQDDNGCLDSATAVWTSDFLED